MKSKLWYSFIEIESNKVFFKNGVVVGNDDSFFLLLLKVRSWLDGFCILNGFVKGDVFFDCDKREKILVFFERY